ncbi:MAG: hypothetical protein AB7V55_07635 [Oscillospiraceae bacterium]
MEYLPFPALLETDYNQVREFGTAHVVADDAAVDFVGEFVPLVPLGTRAVVHWITGNTTTDSFAGEVYLSSPSLLRIVRVNAEQVAFLRLIFAANTHLPATVQPASDRTAARKGTAVPMELLYLSPDAIKLRTAAVFEAGQRLLLNVEVDFLTLANLPLVVRRQVFLRRQDALLLCAVESSSEENLIALSAYNARLEHLDPDAPPGKDPQHQS